MFRCTAAAYTIFRIPALFIICFKVVSFQISKIYQTIYSHYEEISNNVLISENFPRISITVFVTRYCIDASPERRVFMHFRDIHLDYGIRFAATQQSIGPGIFGRSSLVHFLV